MDRIYSTKLADRVYMLDTYALGQPKTVAAYVIKGPKVALVDCGYASSYESVLEGLAEIGVAPSDVRYLIPTHVHLDHSGAAGRLLRDMPNAEVIAHQKAVPHLVDPTKLMESATKVFGEVIMQLYGAPEPIQMGRITAVDTEAHLDLGDGMTATLVHSPGHAPHQISVMLDESKDLLTADAVGIVYPELSTVIPTTPPPSFDPDRLVSSVRSLELMGPVRLLTPHFGPRSDVAYVFENTKEKVMRWVRDVGDMRGRGASVDDAAVAMELRVSAETGVKDLPIYVKVSIRTSVMGIMQYLNRKT
ncbi:MAG: MBL fold metallo-hydrolase [Thaumarchaeota archaeon]|nr:MBL fold metallo-hydrolase [Nitrososphaerota archaeon]